MKRAIARWQTWWLRLFVTVILVDLVVDLPFPVGLLLMAASFALFLARPPASDREPVEVRPPVRGRWTAINSPGHAVPSHGVRAYGQAYAVDLVVPADEPTPRIGWGLRGRAPTAYPAFGRPVLAVAPGTVVAARDDIRDKRAFSTWPLILWMLTLGGFLRELWGAPGLLGNHVVLQHADGTWSAYAHLRRGSAPVRRGDEVEAGQQLAEVGNTGNTSEPHLHVQLMDHPRLTQAAGVPMRWAEVEIEPGDREERWTTGDPKPTALAGFPGNGQVFTAP